MRPNIVMGNLPRDGKQPYCRDHHWQDRSGWRDPLGHIRADAAGRQNQIQDHVNRETQHGDV